MLANSDVDKPERFRAQSYYEERKLICRNCEEKQIQKEWGERNRNE
jgi:hypothetical protein